MKKLYILTLLVFGFLHLQAQTVATTLDGRNVILYDNGRWKYADRNSPSRGSTDFFALYDEAYKYAYDVLYADVFFSTDRSDKAVSWAKEYVHKNLYIPVGTRTLEQWYEELYKFADNQLFKNIIFSPDREKAAISWVDQVLMDKAYFEDDNLSVIARHQIAFDIAYKYIYQNEFFDTDRRKKALHWASGFVKR